MKAEEQHLHLNTLQDRMELGLILFVLSTLRSTEYFKNMGGKNFAKLLYFIYNTLRLNNDLLLQLFFIFFWAEGRRSSSWFKLLKHQCSSFIKYKKLCLRWQSFKIFRKIIVVSTSCIIFTSPNSRRNLNPAHTRGTWCLEAGVLWCTSETVTPTSRRCPRPSARPA